MSTYYDKASLVMIPSGVKEDKLYSIKPTDGSGDFTFSRNDDIECTRVNSSGLIEKAKVNDLLSSSDVSTQSTYWTANQGGVTTQNATTSPIGTNTATQITANGANNYSGVTQNVTMSAARFTYSVYLKAVSGSPQVRLTCFDGVTFHQTDFTLTTSWERYSITFSAASGTNGVYITSTQAVSWYAWGAQLNYGQVAQDYVETTTTAVVEGLTADLPRLDYSGGASCPSLLLEPSRSNLITQSDYISGLSLPQSATITSNAATSPEGVINATSFVENSATDRHRMQSNSISVTSGTAYTFSMFAKIKSGTRLLCVNADFLFNTRVYFDLVNGEVEGVDSGSASIEDYGNGWYRCSATGTATTTQSSIIYIGLEDNTSDNGYTGDGTSGHYWYGFQCEAGRYPTSYIPTYGPAANRGADNCVKTGIGSLVGASEYTIFWEGSHIPTGEFNSFATIYNSSALGESARFYRNNTDNQIYAAAFISGNSVSLASGITTESAKCAFRVKSGDFALYVNGSLVASSTSSMTPSASLNSVNLQYFNSGQSFDQNTKQMLFFQTALTNAELAALTTI